MPIITRARGGEGRGLWGPAQGKRRDGGDTGSLPGYGAQDEQGATIIRYPVPRTESWRESDGVSLCRY